MSDLPLLQYKSLEDIRLRKEELRKELMSDNQSMKTHWATLFRKQDVATTPTKRITKMVATSATVIDGLIFAWKLYNRLGIAGKRQSSKKNGKRKSLLASLFSI